MNERRKWSTVLMTITIFVMTTAFLPGLVRAGNLEPSAPPGSTMHTLDEIYNKLDGQPCDPCEPCGVPKTGQTTPYAAGDDGDLEKGVTWPDPRFTDHGDGTVTDNLTGLMWTKDANMYGKRAWTNALSECAGCTEGDHDDWRLSNVRELHSLIDYGQYIPALLWGHPFSNLQSWVYWSSTTYVGDASHAWYVNLLSGDVRNNSKDNGYHVWCVRGGE